MPWCLQQLFLFIETKLCPAHLPAAAAANTAFLALQAPLL
jgi:hypothetical protein